PTWMFALLNDQRKGVRAVDRLLPDWLRPDFWAVARILDRTFRVYFRELVVMAVAVGLLTYLGLLLLARLGVQGIPFPILLALLACSVGSGCSWERPWHRSCMTCTAMPMGG